jgi:hypothetical protein
MVVVMWKAQIWWDTLKAVRVETNHGVFINWVSWEGLFEEILFF